MTEQTNPMRPLTEAERERLKASIAEFGILKPVHLGQHYPVIDGHHRIAIAKELGIPYPTIVVRDKTALEEEILARELNVTGRDLSEVDRVREYEHLKALYVKRGNERQKANLNHQSPSSTAANAAVEERGRADERAADVAGFSSSRTAERRVKELKELEDAGEHGQALLARVEAGELTLIAAFKKLDDALTEQEKAEKRAEKEAAKAERLQKKRDTLHSELDAISDQLAEAQAVTERAVAEARDAGRYDVLAELVTEMAAATGDETITVSEIATMARRLDPRLATLVPNGDVSNDVREAMAGLLGKPLRSPVLDAMDTRLRGRTLIEPLEQLRALVLRVTSGDVAEMLQAWSDAGKPEDMVAVLDDLATRLRTYHDTAVDESKVRLHAVK
jgi:ParB-like nuclease domain